MKLARCEDWYFWKNAIWIQKVDPFGDYTYFTSDQAIKTFEELPVTKSAHENCIPDPWHKDVWIPASNFKYKKDKSRWEHMDYENHLIIINQI